ncbi:hypothetical protein EI427_25070 [Flammeovirga pectinis]|uniref:Uncharacterized protein n=1 Tax=Flammeovirga pectinis TaxID=2494373 RepID=A0A3S9PBD8_9BACT|nr:hypothetical protein [Flammeovirga pectinis]AZQ65487.1 hypothetical protein EI427_25070 [Flammeovirga pectinis]
MGGASAGLVVVGGDVALHCGIAYDSKDNILIYSSGEFFVDFLSTRNELFKKFTAYGNLATSETV